MSWRRWSGPWPGRGPFSYLPPWQRPGWRYGPGACWWLFGPGYTPNYNPLSFPSPTEQIEELENYRKGMEEELNEIDREIERLKKQIQSKIEE